MKRLAVILLVVLAACGPPLKNTLSLPAKCDLSTIHTWRYSHTEYWTTEEAIYGYRYDWNSGEYKWGQTGTETIHHQRDVWSCQRRR